MSLQDKIRASTKKNGVRVTRARKEAKVEVSLAKIVKKAAQIADLMTGEDVEQDLRVLREAKQANHRVYDKVLKDLVEAPDHKTRLAATTLSRAYHEGLPIARSVNASANFGDLSSELANVSPQTLRILEAMTGRKLGPVIDVQETVPETPSELPTEENQK